MSQARIDHLWSQMEALVDRAGGAEKMTAAQRQEWGRLHAAREDLKTEERVKQLVSEQGLRVGMGPGHSDDFANDTDPEYSRTFAKYIRRGMAGLSGREQSTMESGYVEVDEARALGTLVGSSGGFVVPQSFVTRVWTAMSAFGGLRSAPGVEVITTSNGRDLPYPNSDDTSNVGEIVVENEAVAEQDVAFGQTTLKAWTWSSKLVKASRQFVQDNAIDFESWLARQLGRRIAAAQASFLINGTGTAQPEGIATNVTVGAFSPLDSDEPSITYADLVNMEQSIDSAYWPGASWLVSPSAIGALRNIVDQEGRPLLIGQDSGVGGFGQISTLLGYPVVVDASMGAVADGEMPIIFGNLSGYAIRQVQDVQLLVLDQLFAANLQIAYLAYTRMDARPIFAGAAPYAALQIGDES